MESRRLPLFPLPVVLFPGETMPLHIFEPRYRTMVDRCLGGDRPFGLLYHDWDEMGPFLNEPGRVGTVAGIDGHRPLPDGRSLILVRGRDRFRIVREIEEGAPYFEAEVEPHDDVEPGGVDGRRERRRSSLRLFRAAVRALGEGDELPGLGVEGELSFRLARRIRIDAAWQHALLELRDEERRLERLDVIFHRALKRSGAAERGGDGNGGPSGPDAPGR